MMKTLNWYHLGRKIPQNAVYIGRGNRHLGLPNSRLANPFKLGDFDNDRGKVLEMYESWLTKAILTGDITIEEVLALDGKDVVCYCAPKPCHGDILIKVIPKLKDKSNKEFRINWSRKEGYQVNSKGDAKFSAFNAIMPDGRSIEEHYQCDVKGYDPGGTDWRLGKNKKPLRKVDLMTEYLKLWRIWAKKNPELMDFLYNRVTMHKFMLGDFFATTDVNQAHALSIILNEKYLGYKRVIVAGSRNFNNYDLLCQVLDDLPIPISTIINGTASGADEMGGRYAADKGIHCDVYPADWDNLGKKAGYIRNTEMAKVADVLVAFWDGESKGTKHMIEIAKSKKLKVILIMV